MENKEIIEGNKLIAEFMGVKNVREYELNSKHKCLVISDDDGFIDYVEGINFLSYNDSWNRLMPVVEKIENTGCVVEISYSLVCMCRICVIGKKHEKSFNITNDNNGGLNPIISIWRSVVEFIKWYNENK